jgi:hypothetical protein
MSIPNEKLRQAFIGLMARKGRSIERVIGPPSRGPAKEVYRLPDGQTLRLRTNNKPALMARTESSALDAPLPFEGEDFVGVAFPSERAGFVLGYLVPTSVAVRAMRDGYREWLGSDNRGRGDNKTRVLRFDGDSQSLSHDYANRWSEYCLGEIEVDAPPAAGRSTALDLEVANARRRIAAAAGKPESAVRIAIDY